MGRSQQLVGATALAEWSVSNDGKRVTYAVQDGGTDWRTIRVLDVNTGKVLDDEVKWARFPSIAWMKDESGFFYSRYPEPKQSTESQASVANQAVYFHAIDTSQDGLAIQGGSNGDLLIGAVVNQRPDLFAAALPQVGVMDMLRFGQFTSGKTWVDAFGSPAREADFRNLSSDSPYHNIESGKAYPAILATTADTDDRVVPGHTFKYVAALQAADIGDKPHLARIETRAGHGTGKPTDKIIEETVDMWAFAAHWTGLASGMGHDRGMTEHLWLRFQS